MRMTWKLANRLMDDLCCLAISAIVTTEDTPYPDALSLPNEMMELVEKYANEKFQEICEEWEDTFDGEGWEIEEPKDNWEDK